MASVSIHPTTAGDYVRRAKIAGLTWPLPDDLDDDALELALFGSPNPVTEGIRPEPNGAKIHLTSSSSCNTIASIVRVQRGVSRWLW